MPRALVDFETYSEQLLKGKDSVGAWRYAEDPSTEVLFLGYELPGQERRLWVPEGFASLVMDVPGEPFPQDLLDHVLAGHPLEAHHASFEMAIWLRLLHERMGIPMPQRWIDTMATCAQRSLPLGLDEVGAVLDLPLKKDKRGEYLLGKVSRPQKITKSNPHGRCVDAQLYRETGDYCLRDVATERSLGDTVGDLPRREYSVWALDQRINARGVQLDLDLARGAVSIIAVLQVELEAELAEMTSGSACTGKQVAAIRDWLAENGLHLDNLQSFTVETEIARLERLIAEEEDEEHAAGMRRCHRVLEIRQQLASASIAKFDKALRIVCRDGRARGLLQYHAAGPGRWAGRLLQPQNFPRGELESYVEALGFAENPRGGEIVMEMLVRTVKLGGQAGLDLLRMTFGNPVDALVTALRGLFVAAPGKLLRVADFSAIEAVVTAWLAGEQWKVDAFREINSGRKYLDYDDIYCATASKILGRIVSKRDKADRQTYGKVPELAFGFGGSIGAWYNFDKGHRTPEDEVRFINGEWRKAHPQIRSMWYALEEACVQAVLNPGKVSTFGRVGFQVVDDRAGRWLNIILPSGRRLWYFDPHLRETTVNGRKRQQVCYQGRDNKRGGRWGVVRTWGGMITQNLAEGIARDLMVEAMFRVERAGYSIVLTVHDEIMAEDDEGCGSIEEFCSLMRVVPPWAEGCPVGVAGYETLRYRKD